MTRQALHLRRRRPEAFGAAGAYEPLAATGEKAEHVVGFTRGGQVATIVPRLVLGLAGRWGDTTVALPDGLGSSPPVDVLTGVGHRPGADGRLRVADVLGALPVACLRW